MGENVKHTPGPWMVSRDDPLEIMTDDEHGVNALIATVELDNVEEPQAMADARLIAASPELLEVLKLFVRAEKMARDGNPPTGADELIELGDAAIAKAESRP